MSQLRAYDLYLDALDEINIEERGQLTIDRFNRFANKAVKWFIDYLTGRLQEMPQPKMELIKVQKIADLLKPMLRRRMQPFNGSIVPYPEDYNFLVDLRVTGQFFPAQDCTDEPQFSIDQILSGAAGFRQVDVLSHDKIANRINSNIPLLKKKPCAEQYSDGYMLYPYTDSGSAFIAYLIEPADMKLVMAIDNNTGGLVPDHTASVNPPVDKQVSPILARRIAQYFAHWVREDGAIGSSDAVAKNE
jgi:hypothetical protein